MYARATSAASSAVLEVAARRTEPLQGKGEAAPLDVELEATLARVGPEHRGQPLALPEPAEHERRPPGPGGHRLHARRPHPLHDAQAFAEPGERLEEVVERAVRDELIAPAQRGDHVLADAAAVATGFDDLKILARVRASATTLHAHEHVAIIGKSCSGSKKEMRG